MTHFAIDQTHHWLLRGQRELEEVIAKLVQHPEKTPKLLEPFERAIADQLISVARLQAKANKKFAADSQAHRVWWATTKSLQQATPWQVARLKASWFGNQSVFDLCCGVGGDAMQLSQRGPVTAIDADPLLAAMAHANLVNRNDAEVICSDVTQVTPEPGIAIHIDPDRRADGYRTSAPEAYQPEWAQVLKLVANASSTVIKLAPVAEVEMTELPAHRCWISLQGSVREQSLLLGDAIPQAGVGERTRSAVVISGDGTTAAFAPDMLTDRVEESEKPLLYMIDPDAAIRAAGLTGAFAVRHGLLRLGKLSGFLTSSHSLMTSTIANLATLGEVIWSGACDDRKLRREFRNLNVYPEVIKARGTDHDPAMLANRYRNCGETPVTLWIGRSAKRVYAVMTRPIC
jgi:hypothetical protein